jgi:hypothetical protein
MRHLAYAISAIVNDDLKPQNERRRRLSTRRRTGPAAPAEVPAAGGATTMTATTARGADAARAQRPAKAGA